MAERIELSKRLTWYDNVGAPSRVVKDGVRYFLWAEYSTKREAQSALKFARSHRKRGFIRKYLSKYTNPVYVYYTTP